MQNFTTQNSPILSKEMCFFGSCSGTNCSCVLSVIHFLTVESFFKR